MRGGAVGRARELLALLAALGLAALLAGGPVAGQERELILARGQQLFLDGGCLICHAVRGNGGTAGPDLTEVGNRYDEAALGRWMRDPTRHKVAVHTQKFEAMTDGKVQALAAYLASLRGEGPPR